MIKKVKKGSGTYILLTILEKSVDGYVRLEDFMYNPKIYTTGWDRPLKKSQLALAISRLKQAGFIENVKSEQGIIIKLTTSGKDLISEEKQESWDGKWRIVIFDIPEQKRIIRNLLRRNLKKWGFEPLQKSVWISKRDVYDKLTRYIKDLDLEKWVNVIESDKISHITS